LKGRYIFAGILALVIFLIFFTASRLFGANQGEVNIVNRSSLEVVSGELEVCGQKFKFDKLKQGTAIPIKFKITSDSDYRIDVQFGSGKNLAEKIGYVTRGFDVKDEILIKDDSIILGETKVK